MASRPEILSAIEALEVHCRAPLMSVDQRSMWLNDWCKDLADFPGNCIEQACRQWRHSGQTRFPTPGQLIPLVRAALPVDRSSADNAVWRPLSDEEYRGLTIREKIRHQMILSHEARRKAGPMFRNTSSGGAMSRASGQHIVPEDMPPIWRKWNSVASDHEAEAARLRKLIREKHEHAA